jgi:hypothetical protein
MKRDLLLKIQKILDRDSQVTEDEVRSVMILVRKLLEVVSDRAQYLTLNLFCNWAVHTKITQSITGLKVLARLNDALVKSKNANGNEAQAVISQSIAFDMLYSELMLFLRNNGVPHKLADRLVWERFLRHLIEIVRDVPLAFPPIAKLKGTSQTIYKQIVQKPIKPGAGVVSIRLSNVDYGALGAKGIGEILCLIMQLEDSTQIVVPFVPGVTTQ